MERTIALSLNNFASIPTSLRSSTAPVEEITITLANLYHHYYLDTYGFAPPDPDPSHFEYARFVCPERTFRLTGQGLGASIVARRNRSTDLGQAFCRLFLHDHLGIAHFTHLRDLMDREKEPAFAPVLVRRVSAGNTPDYLCGRGFGDVYLAEAKGCYSPVRFSSAKFGKWRNQFENVAVFNREDEMKSVKGYIVETAFATEFKPSSKTHLFAEDPTTGGPESLDEREATFLANRVMTYHYSNIVQKLGQELLASALAYHFTVPEQIRFTATAWDLLVPNVVKERFIGGYFAPEGREPMWDRVDNTIVLRQHPFRLNYTRGTFFGLIESAFKAVVAIARGVAAFQEVPRIEQLAPLPSALSLLRDGSVLGPVEFFRPVDFPTF